MGKPDDGLARLRAWWLQRQGLSAASPRETIAACVQKAGWLATSSSTGLYLSIRARLPGVSRQAIDRAAIDGIEIVEVPGGHARPYVVVPREEVALALRLHLASSQKHLDPLFANGTLNRGAFSAVGAQVCRALDEGPLSGAEIRAMVTHPDAGELLTVVMNDLALRGIVRRFPIDGRLDASKYSYDLGHPDDRPDLESEGDAPAVAHTATRLFLRRHGPATVDEISWWGAIPKRAVRTALAALQAQPVAISGWTKEAWLLPDDLRAWKSFSPEGSHRIVLLPYRDPFVHGRRPVATLACSDTLPVLDANLNRVAIRSVDGLNHHAIVCKGELVGVWEFDPETRRIVTRVWSAEKALRRQVAAAAADTESFIRDELGDVKLSAVDPPARRAKRLAFCRGRGR